MSPSAKPGLHSRTHSPSTRSRIFRTEYLALLLRRLSPAAGMFGKDYSAGAPLGLGRPNSTDCAPRSTTIERKLIARTCQPSISCPSRSRDTASVLEPRSIARLVLRLTIVPIRVSNGHSGGGGARASCVGGGATIGTATIGGRREAENGGRSRVAERARSGTVHNGLPTRDFAPGSAARGAPDRPAVSATPVPSVAGADAPSTSGAGRAGSSIGPAGARVQKLAKRIPNSRITLMPPIA
jgi:hypothetical protein